MILLEHVSKGLFEVLPLEPADYSRIAELNVRYKDLPGDFADLSLLAVAERLDISRIASLDRDFDVYRLRGAKKFQQVFPKHGH